LTVNFFASNFPEYPNKKKHPGDLDAFLLAENNAMDNFFTSNQKIIWYTQNQ
jgi:hypothetical protein